MAVLTDLKNRGVCDMFFLVRDGLKDLPDIVLPLATAAGMTEAVNHAATSPGNWTPPALHGPVQKIRHVPAVGEADSGEKRTDRALRARLVLAPSTERQHLLRLIRASLAMPRSVATPSR
jgi:hypothetical protein